MPTSASIEMITGRTGEQHVLAVDDAEIYRTLLGDGDYLLVTGSRMNAQMAAANKVNIYNGTAIMQGRQVKIRSGYVQLEPDGGVIGYKREDAIVIEYNRDNEGIESATLKVIKGANSASVYQLPAITEGDIDAGETHQMLLWSVRYDGINFAELVDHRIILDTTPIQAAIDLAEDYHDQIEAQMARLQSDVADFIEGIQDDVIAYADDLAEAVGARISGFYRGSTNTFTLVGLNTLCSVTMPAGYVYQDGDLVIVDINGRMIRDNYLFEYDNGQFDFTILASDLTGDINSLGVTVIR